MRVLKVSTRVEAIQQLSSPSIHAPSVCIWTEDIKYRFNPNKPVQNLCLLVDRQSFLAKVFIERHYLADPLFKDKRFVLYTFYNFVVEHVTILLDCLWGKRGTFVLSDLTV